MALPPCPPDWQLPSGVTPELWEYLHCAEMAQQYEASLADSPVITAEKTFLTRYLPERGLVLDLGCGTGRHLRELTQPRRVVVGVDLSVNMLQQAAAHRRFPLVRANLVGLDCLRDACADAALCLFGTLGLLHPAQARRQVVQAARRVLRPGGVLVLHVHNRQAALLRPGQRLWYFQDVFRSLWTGAEKGNWSMPAHQGLARLTMHLFSRSEITALLHEAGFKVTNVWPLGFRPDGRLAGRWWWPNWRAHGFLLSAVAVDRQTSSARGERGTATLRRWPA